MAYFKFKVSAATFVHTIEALKDMCKCLWWYTLTVVATAFPLLFGFKGKIGRVGGAVMLLCFVLYTWYLIAGV